MMGISGSKSENRARMYKSRISRWNIEKKMKARDVVSVLQRSEYHSQDHGRPSIVTVDGRVVHLSRVQQYIERRRRQNRTSVKQMWRPDNPRPALTAAARLQIPEEMGRLIQQYIDGSFEVGAWIAGEQRDQLRSSKSTGIVVDSFNLLFDACALLNRNEVPAGFAKIHESLDIMGRALSEEDPHLLGAAFRVLALCQWYGLMDIYGVLSTHLQRLSLVVLGSSHPATRVLTMLITMAPEDREVGLKIAAELHTRHLQHRLMRCNIGACLHLLMSYVDTLESLEHYDEATKIILEIVSVPDSRFSWSNETLRLYLQFLSRPLDEEVYPKRADLGIPVGNKPVTYVDTVESWMTFAPVLSDELTSADRVSAAADVVKYCYEARTRTLREGRGNTNVIKGGPNMWPSVVTCEDKERVRVLKNLVHRSDDEPGQITKFDISKYAQFSQRQMPESLCRGTSSKGQLRSRLDGWYGIHLMLRDPTEAAM